MNGLTTIASIPQAGGSMSSLPAEVGKPREFPDMTGHPIWGPVVMRAPYFAWLNEPEEMPGVLTQEEMLALITWGQP